VLFRIERSKLEESSAALNDRVEKLQEAQRDAQANTAHQEYLKQLGPLEDQVKRLTAEKDSWESVVAGGVEGSKADIAKAKEETSLLMDNINTIEGQLQSLLNGDKAAMEPIRQYCYGALYAEGEGLPEIEGL
jgi:predicted transcriptional regulator